ncbi:MAG: 16S rRNA (cytosine(1402)-N(4))-methyltransferase RsmH [Acutalibacteraceae bacterium]|nr:16S rRNA (cytosine(1402)-N(4))-methyltransferase RsmH [Acutalibacteraceae bacterium]
MEFKHISVLLNETIESLGIVSDGIYVDGTAGGAGHSKEIAKRLDKGLLIALDRDPEAVKVATERLEGYNAKVINSNFSEMDKVLSELEIDGVNGILLDLGVSSYQLDNAERGFSYHKDAPLDMRMSSSGVTAGDLVNNLSAEELIDIFYKYGEEKFSSRIARKIVEERSKKAIETTLELAEIIAGAVPAAARRDGHPARKVFQALRIAVNGELESLEKVLDKAFNLLKAEGRLAIITFHSLEDRMVKNKFKEYCTGCTCPPDFPVCVCGKKPRGRLLSRKPIEATKEELELNPRSRSAKLRVIIKEAEN